MAITRELGEWRKKGAEDIQVDGTLRAKWLAAQFTDTTQVDPAQLDGFATLRPGAYWKQITGFPGTQHGKFSVGELGISNRILVTKT